MRIEFTEREYLDGYHAVLWHGTPSAVKALRTHPNYQPVEYADWDTCERYALDCGTTVCGIGWTFAELDKYLCRLNGGDYEAEKGADAAYTDYCMLSPDAQYSYLLRHEDAELRYYRHLCDDLELMVDDNAEPAEMLAMIRKAL